MNAAWKQYLTGHGATIDQDRVTHFDDPTLELKAARDGTILCELSHFGFIQIEGEDATRFLQGQLSNDVQKLNNNSAHYTAYCTPKGRILAAGLLVHFDSRYWLQLPKEIIESTVKRLKMYVLRSKVQITGISDSMVTLGLSGPQARSTLKHAFGNLPDAPYRLVEKEGVRILCLSPERYQIILTVEQVQEIWERLSLRAIKVGGLCWDWLLIRSGIPTITLATQDQFVPQMVNYDLVDGVSFEKGCYPGQEIVARTKYLGKANRRMVLAHVDTDGTPQPGDELFCRDMGDQACGSIVNVALSPSEGYDVLASGLVGSIKSNEFHWKVPYGPKLTLLSLPYPLDR